VCEYADAQGGPPGHRDGAAVAPVRRQLLAASRSAVPRRRWTIWKSGAGGGTRSALEEQHRKLQQGFVAVYAVARTTAPIVASEPARAQSSGPNGSSSEQLFSYLSSSESEAVFTADSFKGCVSGAVLPGLRRRRPDPPPVPLAPRAEAERARAINGSCSRRVIDEEACVDVGDSCDQSSVSHVFISSQYATPATRFA
jgi:hypothetical protein